MKSPQRFTFDPLPKGLVTNKPLDQETYDESIIYDLERKDSLIISRKRDGWKLYIVFYKGQIKIYTSGLNRVDDKFPHFKEELQKLNLPSKTVLIDEGYIERNGVDDLGLMQSIFKSSTEKALALQEQFGKAKLMIFGVMFYEGKELSHMEYLFLYGMIRGVLSKTNDRLRYISPIEILDVSYDEAKKIVEEKGWEGLVLYDKRYQFTFSIKESKRAQRPQGCYKWKPKTEGDFIVREIIYSPDDPHRVKEVVLTQIDPVTNQEFECGKFGLFSNKIRAELTAATLPLVMQIEYGRRFPSGKIREAKKLIRIRTDKAAEECFAPKSYKT